MKKKSLKLDKTLNSKSLAFGMGPMIIFKK